MQCPPDRLAGHGQLATPRAFEAAAAAPGARPEQTHLLNLIN
jgi:hypothetical protein